MPHTARAAAQCGMPLATHADILDFVFGVELWPAADGYIQDVMARWRMQDLVPDDAGGIDADLDLHGVFVSSALNFGAVNLAGASRV